MKIDKSQGESWGKDYKSKRPPNQLFAVCTCGAVIAGIVVIIVLIVFAVWYHGFNLL